ncbi:YciI family protein [Nesterenkonia sp. K-15-9-6]|uniref:YciI family protein n=1 Tax=Nesterenkonia sp. K-15-9-6 TaxID=3093918 RepID=UPI004043D043
MRCTLLLYYPEPAPGELTEEQLAEGMRAFDAYATSLEEAGVLRGLEVLHDTHATTSVSGSPRDLRIQEGPFADGEERLGGIVTVEVADLDEAVAWAGRAPAVEWGHIEIRPVATRFVDSQWLGEAPVS